MKIVGDTPEIITINLGCDIIEINLNLTDDNYVYSNQIFECLEEKIQIMTYSEPEKLLNKRCELIARCRHKSKFKR